MRKVTYSLGMSADGYIVGPDGRFDWSEPDDEVFRFATDEVRGLHTHLLGRHLYEAMVYWEPADGQDAQQSDAERFDAAETEFAELWRALPKVVFSTTLTQVQGKTRLATGGLREEIERLRAEPGEGDIGIGGATLAAAAATLGLIDEYRVRVYPVFVGGGTPYFPRLPERTHLELLETRPFACGVVYLRYRVARSG